MSIKISVAMTTYNGERYLREQLDSILNQTYKSFELIVCDDCSSDSTVKILNEYATKDFRLKVFLNEKNLGFKKNFEKAISLCSGDYIALSDQDDVWTNDHIEKLYSIIGNRSLACGNSIMIDENKKSLGKRLNEVEGLFSFNPDTILYKVFFDRNCFQGASMLCKNGFLKSCLPIPEAILFHDTWFAMNACMQDGIVYTFDVVSNYRQHGNNITFKNHNSRKLCELISSSIKSFFLGCKTDRYDYCDELFKKYGDKKEPFLKIYKIVLSMQNHFGLMQIKFFWKNFESIMTRKGHKGFLKKIITWSRWKK